MRGLRARTAEANMVGCVFGRGGGGAETRIGGELDVCCDDVGCSGCSGCSGHGMASGAAAGVESRRNGQPCISFQRNSPASAPMQ